MMAEASLYTFDHKEVVAALIKQQDLNEGIWQLYFEFGFVGANISPGPTMDLAPSAITTITKVGIRKVDQENNMAVDAAKINPKKKQSKPKAPSRRERA